MSPIPVAHHGCAVGFPLTAAGHSNALETLLEVLEQEAEDQRQWRIGRLRTASGFQQERPGEILEHDRVPLALR